MTTVKTITRSHRAVFMVMLLAFAVALTTALVLAGERKAEGKQTSTSQTNTVPNLSAVWLSGNRNA